MACCCEFTDVVDQQFTSKKAGQELHRYRRKGAGPTTRLLIDGISRAGVGGGSLLDIGAANAQGGQAAAKALAEKVIDTAYGSQMGPVLFKPTLTIAPQTFRTTRAGALSYFVGGDPAFPKDEGFALKGWTRCEVANSALFIAGDSASSQGNVSFTGKDGKVTTVDKTWSYVKDDAGRLRIVVHHSSLPYAPR